MIFCVILPAFEDAVGRRHAVPGWPPHAATIVLPNYTDIGIASMWSMALEVLQIIPASTWRSLSYS